MRRVQSELQQTMPSGLGPHVLVYKEGQIIVLVVYKAIQIARHGAPPSCSGQLLCSTTLPRPSILCAAVINAIFSVYNPYIDRHVSYGVLVTHEPHPLLRRKQRCWRWPGIEPISLSGGLHSCLPLITLAQSTF